MSNRICICGHDENKHKPMSESNEEVVCFHENTDKDESTLTYCACMNFEEDPNKSLQANYDALQSPMPCGHLARYAVNEDEGTQYCVMCVLDATQLTIINLVNEDEQ